ncbi:MAG: hypothetical protein AABZ73_04040 [Pseudomonadota bacterium]|uniref:hypothetical protein n=1 Tax=Sphingobium sp. TaxID=1912891 RepID=UPI002E202AFF
MTEYLDKQKRLHFDLTNVGLRAHATSAGLVQLCLELRRSGVLDDAALERIKGSIACDIEVSAPRSVATPAFRRDVRARIDRIFAGEEKIGHDDLLPVEAMDDEAFQGHA